jgi:hypothetical protein
MTIKKYKRLLSFFIFVLIFNASVAYAKVCVSDAQYASQRKKVEAAIGELFCPIVYPGKVITWPAKGVVLGVNKENNKFSIRYENGEISESGCGEIYPYSEAKKMWTDKIKKLNDDWNQMEKCN